MHMGATELVSPGREKDAQGAEIHNRGGRTMALPVTSFLCSGELPLIFEFKRNRRCLTWNSK